MNLTMRKCLPRFIRMCTLTAVLLGGLFGVQLHADTGNPAFASSTPMTSANGSAVLELANVSNGCVTARYMGDSEHARITVTGPDGLTTPWPLIGHEDTVIALTSGSGPYRVMFYEDAGDYNYAVIYETLLIANFEDPHAPFLAPDFYAPYTEDSACVATARELFEACDGDADTFIKDVYEFVISSVAYDENLAEDVTEEYRPDPDAALERGTGICYDYTALMAAMLRSCGIPARVMTGNFGAYDHSWITCLPPKKDGSTAGSSWQTYDPTLGACNSEKEVARVLRSGKDYTPRYIY